MTRGSTRQDGAPEGIPPYAPYSSWLQLTDGLMQSIPAKIDNSYLKQYRFNQSTRSMISKTLKFFDLVDPQNAPTDRLRALAKSLSHNDMSQLRGLVESSYRPYLEDIDLTTVTPDMLRGQLKTKKANGDVARKCASFFVAIADDAGIPLSPHIHRRRRQPKGASATSNDAKVVSKSNSKPSAPRGRPPAALAREGTGGSLATSLVDKFPSADPDWDQETMGKWLDNWGRLLKIVLRDESASDDEEGL